MNTANQATAWARAVLPSPAFSIGTGGKLSRALRRSKLVQTADHEISHYRMSPTWLRSVQVEWLLNSVTHLINESNVGFGVDPRKQSFSEQWTSWKLDELVPAVVFHGSDARNPAQSMEESHSSYFHYVPEEWRRLQSVRAARNREEVRNTGLPVFVTTPDLLSHVEGSTLLPLTVDTNWWEMPTPDFHGRPLRVLHQPSQREPDVKGTRFIDPILRELDARGLIDYVRTEVVSHSGMRTLVSDVDVVVDQLLTGTYGVTAVEALAAGRIVVANIGASTLSAFGKQTPIVNSTAGTLRAVIEAIASSAPEDLAERSQASINYALQWHSGAAAAVVLRNFSRSTIVS